MRMQVAAAIALAALVLAVILTIAPHTTIVANEVSGEVYAVDILGLTNQAKDLPEQKYAAH
jgi:heme/copper-type cytochrome/quinol oxidase subunit 4